MARKKIKVRLVHWNETEALNRIEQLGAAGVEVLYDVMDSELLSKLAKDHPDLIVVDLTRLPAQGRDIGIAVRMRKQTRHIPLLFVGGGPQKVAKTKDLLPDASYTSWSTIKKGLKETLDHAPADPIIPASLLAGYSGTPLPKKLGIRQNSDLVLVNAPRDFKTTLGSLPQNVNLVWKNQSQTVSLKSENGERKRIALWFVRSRIELEEGILGMSTFAEGGRLWILWPKKASRVSTDVSQADVRQTGLSTGLVDFKICAVDETWSGLRFSIRKSA